MAPFASPRSRRAMLEAAVRQLPSTMARLAFIAGFRDPNSGVYSHPAASTASEKVEADELLKTLHAEAFTTWLNYRLEEQKADLDLYFSGLDCGKITAAETWLRLESYRFLIPASADSSKRRLFIASLEALLRAMVRGADYQPAELQHQNSDEPLLTTREVSRWLGVSARTVRLWAESAELPAVKIGRQWRFSRKDIQDWIKNKKLG